MPVITILEALVDPERTDDLQAAYAAALQEPFPPGLVHTMLLRQATDPTRWRIETTWQSHEALADMRRAGGKPRGVQIFEAAGAAPALSIFDAINQAQGRGAA